MVATNNTVYLPVGNVDTAAVQSPYLSPGQMENGGYKIREYPNSVKPKMNYPTTASSGLLTRLGIGSSLSAVNAPVQKKPEQRIEPVQTRADNLIVLPLRAVPKNERVFDELKRTTTQIGSLHPENKGLCLSSRTEETARYQIQSRDKKQATKEGTEKDQKAQRFKVKKQKIVKPAEPKKREESLAYMPKAKNGPKHRKNQEKKNGKASKNSLFGGFEKRIWQSKKPSEPRNEKGKIPKPENARTDSHLKNKDKEKKKGELTKEKVEATNKRKVKSERLKKSRGGRGKEEVTKPKEKKVAPNDTKNLRRELSDKRKKREKAGRTATENKKKQTRQRSTERKNVRAIVRKASKQLPRAVSSIKTDTKIQHERQKRRTPKKTILKILLTPRKKRKRIIFTSSRASGEYLP